jgi:hypothetical protein
MRRFVGVFLSFAVLVGLAGSALAQDPSESPSASPSLVPKAVTTLCITVYGPVPDEWTTSFLANGITDGTIGVDAVGDPSRCNPVAPTPTEEPSATEPSPASTGTLTAQLHAPGHACFTTSFRDSHGHIFDGVRIPMSLDVTAHGGDFNDVAWIDVESYNDDWDTNGGDFFHDRVRPGRGQVAMGSPKDVAYWRTNLSLKDGETKTLVWEAFAPTPFDVDYYVDFWTGPNDSLDNLKSWDRLTTNNIC